MCHSGDKVSLNIEFENVIYEMHLLDHGVVICELRVCTRLNVLQVSFHIIELK